MTERRSINEQSTLCSRYFEFHTGPLTYGKIGFIFNSEALNFVHNLDDENSKKSEYYILV